jgi:hypothetical protein
MAKHDRSRGRHSTTAALAAVGDSSKPAPEVGGEQVLWQGSSVVDRFEAKKGRRGAHRSCPRRRLRLTGNRWQKHGPGVEGAGDWVRELRGAAPKLVDGSAGSSEGPGRRCTVVPQQRHGGAVGGGGRRREKGSFTGVRLPL